MLALSLPATCSVADGMSVCGPYWHQATAEALPRQGAEEGEGDIWRPHHHRHPRIQSGESNCLRPDKWSNKGLAQ